jgi:hypothetical protein
LGGISGDKTRYILPRLQAFFVGAKVTKTKGGLQRLDANFRLTDGSIIKVYAWNDQIAEMEKICVPNCLYCLFQLRVMPNSGIGEDGGLQDRGGSYDIRLLFEEGSNWKMGKIGGGQEI